MAEVNSKVQKNIANEDSFEELDFATMLEESLKETNDVICNGVIIAISNDEVSVDVGKKSEGTLNILEIQDENGELIFKEGDRIKVVIVGSRGGRPILSHRKAIRKEKVKEFIDNYNENTDDIVNVKIIGKNKGGYITQDSNGIEFFLPRSQSGLFKDNKVIGKSFKAKIIKIDPEAQSIFISRKKIVEEEIKRKKEIVTKILENPEIISGTIKKITTYGMFVDVGGVDGLVHYSEISYKGPVNPRSLYKEGDVIQVRAVNYDKDKKHLSLSIKAAMPDPWEEIKDKLEVGDTIQVVVSNIEPYGAFVDLGNDIEGFLHISEISWDKSIKHPKEYINENDEIDVEVIEINSNERRLRVSLKNLLEKPFDKFLSKFKEGDVVKGVVTTVTNFGAFIKIGSLEGLLHNEDSSWDRNSKCKDLFKIGDEVEAKIIKIDRENEKISLSLKELQDSPVKNYMNNHSEGDIVVGQIRDIKDFGIFVELENNVDALIRKEDINNIDNLNIGDNIEAAIVFIDDKKNRIRLSVKRLAKQKEREALKEINNNNDKMTLGDIIIEQFSNRF